MVHHFMFLILQILVVFHPVIQLEGALVINDNFSSGTGLLNFNLAGNTAPTQYDQLNIVGNFSCSGTVNFTTISTCTISYYFNPLNDCLNYNGDCYFNSKTALYIRLV